MHDDTRTELVKALVRAGLRTQPVGAGSVRGMGAGRPEGGDRRPATVRQGEEGTRAPMGNWRKEPEAEAPGQGQGGDHILRLVSSRQRAAERNTGAAPCLRLVWDSEA